MALGGSDLSHSFSSPLKFTRIYLSNIDSHGTLGYIKVIHNVHKFINMLVGIFVILPIKWDIVKHSKNMLIEFEIGG